MPRRAALAFLGAAAALALLILTWYLAFHVGIFERADQSILSGFAQFNTRTRVVRLASFVAGLCNPKPWVFFAVVPVLVALARGRPRVAFAIVAILLGANLTTQLLKPLLAQPRPHALLGANPPIGAASWPSGHATAAMSLALVSVLAAPARLRPAIAALGACFAVAVSYSFLTLVWHYPSDVLGGFLVAGAWTLLVVGALFLADARWPRRVRGDSRRQRQVSLWEALWPPGAALLGSLMLAGLVALARPHQVVGYARAHEAFVVGAATIGAVGLALAVGIVLAMRR